MAFGSSDNKSSADRLFRYKGPITATDEFYSGLASWEPDIWSGIRNRVRVQKYYAQEQAADYAAARLSLQAELATDYFALRGWMPSTPFIPSPLPIISRRYTLPRHGWITRMPPVLMSPARRTSCT